MKILCIMCGLRQLAGAGTNWKFLLSPRPIKLRVNLAPLIIAAGASPLKKNLANVEKYIEQLWQIHVTTLINLAPLIIAAGASPSKKNSSSKLFAQLGGLGIITSSGLLLFSSAQKKSKKILSRSSWERPKYRGGRACASCRPYPRDAYSVIQITTKTHEQPFSLQLCFAWS